MDALCKCMFIVIETIVNTEHEDKTCIKSHQCFSKNLFISIRHMKKETPGSHYLFLCTEQFTYRNRFPLCAHILYFDAAKLSIKLFSLIYFTVSVVRQRNEYEIVTETRPIKTRLRDQLSLPRC